MLQLISTCALLSSLGGNLCINFKKKIGFPIWITSNILWIIVNVIWVHNIQQIIMYLIYIGFNIQGYIQWGNKER